MLAAEYFWPCIDVHLPGDNSIIWIHFQENTKYGLECFNSWMSNSIGLFPFVGLLAKNEGAGFSIYILMNFLPCRENTKFAVVIGSS